MIRYVFQAFEILGLHRLLCKFDSPAPFPALVQNTDCLFRRPCLVRVDSDGNVRSCRLADCCKTFTSSAGFTPTLIFRQSYPLFTACLASSAICSGSLTLIVRSVQICLPLLPPEACKPGYGAAVRTSPTAPCPQPPWRSCSPQCRN